MAKENTNEQELVMKFQMFEQQIRLIQEQLQAVEQAIIEMDSLNLGLDDLAGKKDKEIIAQIGRGIYVKAKLISEDMLIDIGNKNFVTKSIPETKELLKDQSQKLGNVKKELEEELDKINQEITSVFLKHQGNQEIHNHEHPHEHSHKHNHKCKCSGEEKDECGRGEDCECKNSDDEKCEYTEKD